MLGWDDDPELADIGPQSIYKVVRALKKDDHGPYNCLASIVADAAFVRDVRRRYRAARARAVAKSGRELHVRLRLLP